MTRRRRIERAEYQGSALKEELNEFHAQPASGGHIGGRRGKQEYGIEGEVSSDSGHTPFRQPGADGNEDIQLEGEPYPYGQMDPGFPGVSEWSSDVSILTEDELDEEGHFIERSDDKIRSEILEKLSLRESLDISNLEVAVLNGKVTLSGKVATSAARLSINEVTYAIPGVEEIEDRLEVIL